MKAGLLFFVSFLCCVPLWAQLTVGIKGGLNLSDVVINNVTDNPDAESDYKMKAGLHAGVFAIAAIGVRTGISADLLYSVKGVKAIDDNINLYYVSLPVLFQYAITEKWIAEAGPELSYLLTVKSTYGNLNAFWNNKIDLGLDLGLRYAFTPKVSAGLRFNAGFSSVIENSPTSSTGEKIRYQNRVLQLSLIYSVREFKSEEK
jgi:hypothetical protein